MNNSLKIVVSGFAIVMSVAMLSPEARATPFYSVIDPSSIVDSNRSTSKINVYGQSVDDIHYISGVFGQYYSNSVAINDAGQIVGTASTRNNYDSWNHGFLYSNGSMINLGTLGGNYSNAMAINSYGHVVGSSWTTGMESEHAYLYNGGMIDIGALAKSMHSWANAINDLDEVVGWSYTTESGTQHATIFASGQVFDLNLLVDDLNGWALTSAIGINNQGQIIALGSNQNGEKRIFGLNPNSVPEPSSFALLSLSLLSIGYLAYRRRELSLTIAQ